MKQYLRKIKLLTWINRTLQYYYRIIRFGDPTSVSFFDVLSSENIKPKTNLQFIYKVKSYFRQILYSIRVSHSNYLIENRQLIPDDLRKIKNNNYSKCSINNEWKNSYLLINNSNGSYELEINDSSQGIYLFIGKNIVSANNGELKIQIKINEIKKTVIHKYLKSINNRWNLFYYEFSNTDLNNIQKKIKIFWSLKSKTGNVLLTNPIIRRNKNTKQPKVIVLILDALRPKDLGIYSNGLSNSPNIDKFFQKGSIFSSSFSQSNWTLPTFASMATSMYSSQHGIVDPDKYSKTIDREINLLAEVLQKNDVFTYADVSHRRCNQSLGHHRGYDHYKYEQTEKNGNSVKKQINKVCDLINNLQGIPMFSFIHIFDTHFPYYLEDGMIIEKYLTQKNSVNHYFEKSLSIKLSENEYEFVKSRYFQKLSYVDNYLKDLFDLCDREDVTVILTSDHGNSFSGWKVPMDSLNNINIQTPFLIKSNNLPLQNGVHSNFVESSIDLMPTVLQIFDIKPPTSCMGQSIFNNNWELNKKEFGISEIVYKTNYELKIINNLGAHVHLSSTRDPRKNEIDLDNLKLLDYSIGNNTKIVDKNQFIKYLNNSNLDKKLIASAVTKMNLI